jgi:hypothetical protein
VVRWNISLNFGIAFVVVILTRVDFIAGNFWQYIGVTHEG